MTETPIQADYLVVGAGAAGMAFADQLLTDSAATIAIVDRRHRPGGHWNDAYPFVRLHQPSSNYGVNSRQLGSGGKDTAGFNAGLDELASGAEVVSYFENVLQQRLLPSGRVRFFPMSEYTEDGMVESRLSGARRPVSVGKVVDATCYSPKIPATNPPQYAVADGLIFAPINDLPRLARPGASYTVIGAGKTGMDACLWLLQNGAEADRIRWIVPRDSWMLDRANFQTGPGTLVTTLRYLADEVEAIVEADSVDDVFLRLEAKGALLRLDPAVTPRLHHCATVTRGELAALRQIAKIVRLGRVQRIERDRIVLDHGEVPTDDATIHIDCSASAIVHPEKRPVFEPGRINLQCLRLCQPVFSAALIGHVEAANADDGQKNALCQPMDYPSDPLGWLRMMSQELPARIRWAQHPDIAAFNAACRLDSVAPRAAQLQPGDTAELAEIDRLEANIGPAIEKLQILLATA
ncbi:NAD(P)-binding protein [Sandarakinorhabdus rubra]|uniref:NAD(P)-binding protein n=1 Tax=Sandarakinorhabdus rubra TaxID=2672568 RepID=UPI0013DC4016|nr:NAD(P)-binding protein [Sandarakinorhabdus rubra]